MFLHFIQKHIKTNKVVSDNSDKSIDSCDGNSTDTNPSVTLTYYILQRNHLG